MIILIDNYDSFTWNLYHLIGMQAESPIRVIRNDAASVDDVMALNPSALVLSPGPCTPNEAGMCMPLVSEAIKKDVPLLGVCLGHQSIGQALGGEIVRAQQLVHGKVSNIFHTQQGLMKGLPSPFKATRYHSLVIEPKNCPQDLIIDAHTDDGLIMAVHHAHARVYGVQFHPESIASEYGDAIIRNFLNFAGVNLR